MISYNLWIDRVVELLKPINDGYDVLNLRISCHSTNEMKNAFGVII